MPQFTYTEKLPVVASCCYTGVVATISQRELRNDSALVLRRIQAGERLTITRRGIPVADLIPHRALGPQKYNSLTALHEKLAALEPWGDNWEAERADLDNIFNDSERDPWQS